VEKIHRGDHIEVRDATGRWLPKRALGPIAEGHNFPVVWACRPEEWDGAQAEGREPEGTPWPADDVRVIAGSASG
jgi:hypothetical protein